MSFPKFFADVIAKHAATLKKLGVNLNNGFGDLLTKIETLPDAEKKAIKDDITAEYAKRPALAMANSDKGSYWPDVPSMSETVPGYDTEVWWGLLGPAGMPPDVIAKLSHDFVAALHSDTVKARLAKLGATPIGSTPEQFDAKIHADYAKWGPIIKAAGMTAE